MSCPLAWAHRAPGSALAFPFDAIPDPAKRMLRCRCGMRLRNAGHNSYNVVGKNRNG
jgi:hypothetical protein